MERQTDINLNNKRALKLIRELSNSIEELSNFIKESICYDNGRF